MIFRWHQSNLWRDPELADETGLVTMGGDLSPERLLEAYRRGIFPWYDDGLPICWWSPEPRAIFELDGFHISRRLGRTCRSGKFQVSFDRAFSDVIRGCANRPGQGTWITQEMIDAYETLYRLGHGHSVEVWANLPNPKQEIRKPKEKITTDTTDTTDNTDDTDNKASDPCNQCNPWLIDFEGEGRRQLVGGLYGVAVGGLFAGESMFSRQRDASKVALVHLLERLRQREFQLFDIQFLNDHTARLGAVEIPRREYLARLRTALECDVNF